MDAITAVAEQPAPPLQPGDVSVALRMADEGIPVRSIARSLKMPSGDVYELLREALARGEIVEIPRDDWPPGATRSNRPSVASPPFPNDEDLKTACAIHYRATRLEAAILAVLLKRNTLTKQQLHLVIEQNRPSPGLPETDEKMVDVVICHLRKKLKAHPLVIETIWGIGYMIPIDHRERTLALLSGVACG